MFNRRAFLSGCSASLATVTLLPGLTFAAARKSQWLTGFASTTGDYGIARINADLTVTPILSSTERLHGILCHPKRTEFCAPSRRPGTVFSVLTEDGAVLLNGAPDNRHYYGHGTYSANGATLFLTENDFESEQGVIGIYDVNDHYRRMGEISSGGIGPHEIVLHPDGQHLVVANGGILTHPNSGRAKLNLDTMYSTLCLIEIKSGKVVEKSSLAGDQYHLSIRHLAVSKNGSIVFGTQSQYHSVDNTSLVGGWVPGSSPFMLPRPLNGWHSTNGYIGSITLDAPGNVIAATCPRADEVHFWNFHDQKYIGSFQDKDICGISSGDGSHQFLITSGAGRVALLDCQSSNTNTLRSKLYAMRFDNHCQRGDQLS